MSMVRVKMLQQMSGTRNGVPWPERGETMEVSEEEAASLTSGQTPIAEIAEMPKAEEEPKAPDEPPVNTQKEGDGGPANASAAEPPKPKAPQSKGPVVRTTQRPTAAKK